MLRRIPSPADQAAAQHDGGEIGLQHEGAAKCFRHDHRLDRAAAEPTMLLGKRQAQQAEFGELRPHRPAPAAGFGHGGAALIEAVFVGDQTIDAILEQALIVIEIEIH